MLLSYLTWEEETIRLTQFILQEKSYGIYMLKLVGPSECHLLDYVKTNTSPKAISVANVASLFFCWSWGDHQPEDNLKRNIEIFQMSICTHHPFDSLMRSIYLLAIHRANLLITERVPYFSQRCLFAQNIYLYSFPGVLN